MELNIFKNIKQNIETNEKINDFINDLSNFLNEKITGGNEMKPKNDVEIYRKEGHLYLVTEDRGNEVYLWDFTEKAKDEFKEIITSQELLEVAKEGAMLIFKNGKYELYSPYGFDIVEEKNEK